MVIAVSEVPMVHYQLEDLEVETIIIIHTPLSSKDPNSMLRDRFKRAMEAQRCCMTSSFDCKHEPLPSRFDGA